MNLVRKVLSVKFICRCWVDVILAIVMSHTHRNVMINFKPKYGQIIYCGLAILMVFLFFLCSLQNTTQLRSCTVDDSKWPIFLQNASGNPSKYSILILFTCSHRSVWLHTWHEHKVGLPTCQHEKSQTLPQKAWLQF